MEWNYRVVFDEGVWDIRKVYYEDSRVASWSTAKLCGETQQILLIQHKQMQEAFQRPILSMDNNLTPPRLVEINNLEPWARYSGYLSDKSKVTQ